MALLEEPITHEVIGGMYTVHGTMGYGFLESPYVGALEHEFRKRGLEVVREAPIAVHYDGIVVGSYKVDLLVERRVIVEVKACSPHQDHSRQVLNYLRCSELEVGLLLYFQRSVTFKRFIFRNELKRHKNQRAATKPPRS